MFSWSAWRVGLMLRNFSRICSHVIWCCALADAPRQVLSTKASLQTETNWRRVTLPPAGRGCGKLDRTFRSLRCIRIMPSLRIALAPACSRVEHPCSRTLAEPAIPRLLFAPPFSREPRREVRHAVGNNGDIECQCQANNHGQNKTVQSFHVHALPSGSSDTLMGRCVEAHLSVPLKLGRKRS